MQQSAQAGVERNLQPKPGRERHDVEPELGKLVHGELPSGNQRQHAEIRGEQHAEGQHSESRGPCCIDNVYIHGDLSSVKRRGSPKARWWDGQ
jgi:hypothetical protein